VLTRSRARANRTAKSGLADSEPEIFSAVGVTNETRMRKRSSARLPDPISGSRCRYIGGVSLSRGRARCRRCQILERLEKERQDFRRVSKTFTPRKKCLPGGIVTPSNQETRNAYGRGGSFSPLDRSQLQGGKDGRPARFPALLAARCPLCLGGSEQVHERGAQAAGGTGRTSSTAPIVSTGKTISTGAGSSGAGSGCFTRIGCLLQ